MADNFSETYHEAREKLLTACQDGWAHEAMRHPLACPKGRPIFTDILWRGPQDAERVLVLCSGTHGVEGFTGSALQHQFATGTTALPDGMAVMLIHAVNPFGFAHLRRVNEDNIDLNRNFVDFSQGRPENAAYATIDALVNPTEWSVEIASGIASGIADIRAKTPYLEFLKMISGGQYDFPRGIQYGGSGPCWSRRTMEAAWQARLSHARLVVQIDIHTGLGPSGEGVLMMAADDHEPHKAITADWFGPMMVTRRPANRVETILGGYMNAGLEQALGGWIMPMTLEYGTEPGETVMMTMIEDNWLTHHGDPASAQGREVKQRILRAFYPSAPEWRGKILARGEEVIRKAVAGMTALNLESRTAA